MKYEPFTDIFTKRGLVFRKHIFLDSCEFYKLEELLDCDVSRPYRFIDRKMFNKNIKNLVILTGMSRIVFINRDSFKEHIKRKNDKRKLRYRKKVYRRGGSK